MSNELTFYRFAHRYVWPALCLFVVGDVATNYLLTCIHISEQSIVSYGLYFFRIIGTTLVAVGLPLRWGTERNRVVLLLVVTSVLIAYSWVWRLAFTYACSR